MDRVKSATKMAHHKPEFFNDTETISEFNIGDTNIQKIPNCKPVPRLNKPTDVITLKINPIP